MAFTVGVGTSFLALCLDQRWYPWDEGSLGQMAERTLAGQVPHRDFADIYTGGLSFFDASVFWLFGTNLLWLRVAMLPFFIAFLAATYFVALRLVPSWFAALLTITIVVWTVPNYPAAMPSWYNLFFSVLGVAAVVAWLERGAGVWLVTAGFLGGLSFTVKLVGLYYVVGVVFFIVWRTALYPGNTHDVNAKTETARTTTAYGLAAGALAASLATIAPRLGPAELVAFVPAIAAASCTLAAAARACGRSPIPMRAPLALFAAGFAAPVAAYTLLYVVAGGLGSVLRQVFGASQSRLTYAATPPLPAVWVIAVAPFVLLPVVGRLPRRARLVGSAIGGLLYAALLVSHDVSRYFLNPLREVLPALAPAGGLVLVLHRRIDEHLRPRVELLALLLFVAAFESLVQYPFGAPIYFEYILPLVALAAVAFVQLVSPGAAAISTVLVVAYLVAGALHLQPGLQGLWDRLNGSAQLATLDARSGRISIPTSDVRTYATLVDTLRRHARTGITFAGPDAPEVYYLSGLTNPTPIIFDFLTPTGERRRAVLGAVNRPDVHAVVLNELPPFSPAYPEDVIHRIDARFPHHRVVGHFDVRWRP
jgi:hypothetical protein